MSDTSLVLNIVARDHASGAVFSLREKLGTAAAGISTAVAGALGAGIATSLDMSAASTKMAAQLGVGPAKAAELSKTAAKVYASGWGDSTEQVNEAITSVYRNIGDTSKVKGGIQSVTSDVLALSQTFDQDLSGSTAAVGQMIKTGLAKNAKEAIDILTVGFQAGNNKADDLLDTMNEYGTQFRKLGVSGAQAMGIIHQGLKGGARDADLVADSIKEFSIRAVDGSTTTAQGFKAIGLDARTMATQIGKGGAGANKALDLTLDRLRAIPDPVKRSQAAVMLFGTQAEDLGQALYDIDPSKAVDIIGKVEGATQRMSNTLQNSPSAALERFKRGVTVQLADVSSHFVSFAMANQGVMKPLAGAVGIVAGAVIAVAAAQKVYATYTAISNAVTAITTSETWALNAAWLASPLTWIILGIVALVVALVLIATKTTWLQKGWSVAWGAIKGAIAAVWGWIKSNWPLILSILTGPIGAAVIYVVRHWSQLKSGMVSVIGGTVNWLTGKWDALIGYFRRAPGRVASATRGMFDGIKNAFRSAINFVIGGWNGLRFSIPSIDTHIPGAGSLHDRDLSGFVM